MTAKAQEIEEKTINLISSKLNLMVSKGKFQKSKKKTQRMEGNIFNSISYKGLIFRISQVLYNSTMKDKNSIKMGKGLQYIFFQRR
jgi:hypothetical protein